MDINLHRAFIKKFKKLQPGLKARFKEWRNLFLENSTHPLLNNHALRGDRLGQWSINITSDWRAIYEFMDENTILFVDIDTHCNLYN